MKRAVLNLLILVFAVSTAHAAIIAFSTGTAAPPPSIGGVPLIPFDQTGLRGWVPVPALLNPIGVTATLTAPIGDGPAVAGQTPGDWATWSHGYAGDVYWTGGSGSLGVALSAPVDAFLLYAEPNLFGVFTITVTAQDGTSLTQFVDGFAGATGYGFYGTGGSKITSVAVTSSVDFAIAELAAGNIRLPEPGLLLLLGLGIAAVAAWHRKS